MIPHNGKAAIYSPGKELLLPSNNVDNSKYTDHYHLYILSDDEIKEHDYVYIESYKKITRVISIKENFVITMDRQCNMRDLKKIIATTNRLLHKNQDFQTIKPNSNEDKRAMQIENTSMPDIPDSFVREYCSKNGIDEVMIEYHDDYNNCLLLNYDYTVFIS
jgi:hypothetical protein